MRKLAIAVLGAISLHFAAGSSHAQGPLPGGEDSAPERTRMATEALDEARWETLGEGLEIIRARTATLNILSVRIDPVRHAFALAVQSGADGERAEEFSESTGADIVINGGFFGEKEPGKGLYPVGYLRIEGDRHSAAWSKTGGFLVIRSGRLSIVPSIDGVPAEGEAVLQSKPLLIEPGGKWAMNTNLGNLRRRSLVCIQMDGKVILTAITGLGMSLFEAGWLLRDREAGGFFQCDSALALDGGGSTQLWFSANPALSIRGDSAIQNALIVRRRAIN